MSSDEALGWTANLVLVAGLWFVGKKKRWAFLLTLVGELAWTAISVVRRMPDMFAVCAVFAALAAVNYYRWGKGPQASQEKK